MEFDVTLADIEAAGDYETVVEHLMFDAKPPKEVDRHRPLAEATRAGIKALGLSLLAEKSPSDALPVVRVPAGIDGARIPKLFQELCNITIVGGQDRLRGKVFRLAHMGYVDTFDVITMAEPCFYISGEEYAVSQAEQSCC